MIVSFKFYVMNFVDFVIDCYLHITSHVSQTFASCTHYTSYSLLNLVHYIVCDLVVAIQDYSSLILMQNAFNVWVFLRTIGWKIFRNNSKCDDMIFKNKNWSPNFPNLKLLTFTTNFQASNQFCTEFKVIANLVG